MVDAKELREKILSFVKLNGPILPVQASKSVGSNILFSAAVLSELVATGHVVFTNMKVGGSPLYYVKGQEVKLQSFMNHLGEKPKKACLDLQEKKIIRDHECEAWERVALREIKDFAFQMTVKHDDESIETFWKWYLLDEEEAKKIIGGLIEEAKQEVIQEVVEPEVTIEAKQEQHELIKEAVREQLRVEKESIKEEKKEKKKRTKKTSKDILSLAFEFFEKNKIKVISSNIIKKNKEMNYIVEIPSEIGRLNYLVKIKDKVKFTDSDIIIYNSEAQSGKLPMLLLGTGNITKKAEDYINSNLKGYFMFKKLE